MTHATGADRRAGAGRNFIWIAAACLSAAISPLCAEDSVEIRVKAGCLYQFSKFVEWPAEAFPSKDAPFVIGVLGTDPFGDVLDQTVHDRSADGRKIVVRRYKEAKEAREAQILFLGMKGEQRAAAIKDLENVSVLTVGDGASFIESGGIVRFTIRDERVAFDINPDAGKKAKLKISSQLLRLAKVVNNKGE